MNKKWATILEVLPAMLDPLYLCILSTCNSIIGTFCRCIRLIISDINGTVVAISIIRISITTIVARATICCRTVIAARREYGGKVMLEIK